MDYGQRYGRFDAAAIAEMRRFPDLWSSVNRTARERAVRALPGEKLNVSRAEIEAHVACGVAFFLAGCRLGGVH